MAMKNFFTWQAFSRAIKFFLNIGATFLQKAVLCGIILVQIWPLHTKTDIANSQLLFMHITLIHHDIIFPTGF